MRCHIGMDHHCLFLYKCIAQNNHRHFIRFIMTVMLAICLFEYQAVNYLETLYPAAVDAPTDYILQIFKENPWISSLMVANAASIIWGVVLIRFQLKFIAIGTTQFFQLSNKRKSELSFYQKLRNVINFLLGKRLYAKDAETGVLLL